MSTFVKEACKFVQAMFEPILVDGLSGKVSAEVLDGYIDIWVPVSKRDQRRLEPNYWAFNALIQTLAQVLASELPDGVTSDAIAIRLLPPGTRSRSKLQKARQTPHSHQLPAEILGMTVAGLLEQVTTSRYHGEEQPYTVDELTQVSLTESRRTLSLHGKSTDTKLVQPQHLVTIQWQNGAVTDDAIINHCDKTPPNLLKLDLIREKEQPFEQNPKSNKPMKITH